MRSRSNCCVNLPSCAARSPRTTRLPAPRRQTAACSPAYATRSSEMSAPLFFIDSAALDGDRVVIDGDEGRHAADVRRLRTGELVDIGDGCGRLAHGVVAEVTRGRMVV